MQVLPLDSTTARAVVEKEHYLHRKPPVSHAFGLYDESELVGVCIFGAPAIHEVKKSACPTDPTLVLELNRLWVDDRMPRNTESWFVSRCLKALPPRIVVSYADTKENHMGYIYRALNFNYAGWTDMERNVARWEYIPASGKHSRDSFRGGQKSWIDRIRRLPKVKYWTVTGNRRDRKCLSEMCPWPIMSWQLEPPPTTHRRRTILGEPPETVAEASS